MRVCDCCNTPIPFSQHHGNASLRFQFEYGSDFDSDIFCADLCNECKDKISKNVAAMCRHPVIHSANPPST